MGADEQAASVPPEVSIAVVPWDDAGAAQLRADQQAELALLYDDEGDLTRFLPAEQMLATVTLSVDGEVVACGALRDASAHGEDFGVVLSEGASGDATHGGVGEIKRMYVRPDHRGRGYSRLVLSRLVEAARAAGMQRLVLETGELQAAAIGLYRRAGYRRIRNYGPYTNEADSVCYATWLVPDAATRVLVVNGTVGAGKTTIAEVVADLLRERGVPYAWIDADALRRAYPTADDDPFGQAVVLDHLEAMAGVLRRRGYRHVVLAEVIERAADRELYERAFDGAELVVVRLDASEATRLARLTAREPDPWREWHLARTVELAAILESAGVDDAVVDNDGARPLRDVAAQVLVAAGWLPAG